MNYKSSSSVDVINTTVHSVPNDTQQLQERPKPSPKEWMDFYQDAKSQTVNKI